MADSKPKKGKTDRNKLSGSENDEIQYLKNKIDISSLAINGTTPATKSSSRKILKDYLENKHA